MKNVNLTLKTASIFGVILFIVIASSFATIYSIFSTESSIEDTSKLNLSVEELLKLQDEALSIRKNALEFIISGDLGYEKLYHEAEDKFEIELKKLLSSMQYKESTPQELKLPFESAMNMFNTWQKEIVRKQFKYAQNPYTFDMARVLETSQENQKYWEEINRLFMQIEIDAIKLVEGKVNEQKTSLLNMKIVSIVAGLLVVTACIASIPLFPQSPPARCSAWSIV